MELYEKIQQGKRNIYKPFKPVINDRALSDGEVLTLAGALGLTMLHNYSKHVPKHKLVARKVAAVEQSIEDLFKGTGQPVVDEMSNYVMDCWNLAMLTMAQGAKK